MNRNLIKSLEKFAENLRFVGTLIAEAFSNFSDKVKLFAEALPPEKRFELFGVDGLDLDNPADRWVYQKYILSAPLRAARRVIVYIRTTTGI